MTPTAKSFAVAHTIPGSGFFVGRFAVRGKDNPQVLRGPFDEIACAIDICDESTIYHFVAFAENWLTARRMNLPSLAGNNDLVVDIPWVERSGIPVGHSTHQSNYKPIHELIPHIEFIGNDGEKLEFKDIQLVFSTQSLIRWKLTWANGKKHSAIAYADIDSGMPFIRFTIIPRRHDAQGGETVNVTWPWKSSSYSMDFASLTIIREVCNASVDLNEFEMKALNNSIDAGGEYRIWDGIVHNWGGDLLKQPVILGNQTVRNAVYFDISKNAEEYWGGRLNPNAPGVDGSFGSTWTSPLWNSDALPDPRILRSLAKAARMYELRPCHWVEPGTCETLRDGHKDITLHKGQPYDASEANVIKVGPQYRSDDYYKTFDHEHRSVAPLAVYAILTGDIGCRYTVDSYLSAELYERSVKMGWTQAGRGQGLPWIAGAILSMVSNDAHLKDAWEKHNKIRVQQYLNTRKTGSVVTVGGLYTRGSPWVENSKELPYSDPYEQSTIQIALWLNGHIDLAYEHGSSLVSSIWWDANNVSHGAYNQRWINGDWPHQLRVGMPINNDLAKGGDPLGMWVGAGLRCLLIIADQYVKMGRLTGREEHIVIARAAARNMDSPLHTIQYGEVIAASHRCFYGAVPELTRDPE